MLGLVVVMPRAVDRAVDQTRVKHRVRARVWARRGLNALDEDLQSPRQKRGYTGV